jgi:hypothetical protein
MEAAGLIRRDMNGKRCYRIESLVTGQALAAAGYGRRRVDMPAPTDEPLTVAEPEPEPTPPLVLVPRHSTHPSVYPEVDEALPDDEPLSSAVHVDTASLQTFGLLVEAMRLVGLAMAQLPALSAPDPGVAQRLATTLEENQRLRHRAARAEDLNVALKAERDGAVRMKQALQANLDNMAKGAFSPEQYRKFIELDRTMRAAPTSAKGD